MGSLRGNCEILEVKDEHSMNRRPQRSRQLRGQDREQKPPIVKKGYNKTLEDDINKLFEAVNLRTSKSLDLSDMRRNASKKPMRANGSHSPGIGFSEPVSLKQALRGLCISQAAEMAAVKRLSMPASPRISEAGKITNMYRSVIVETGESSCSLVEGEEHGIKISLVPEENAPCLSKLMPRLHQDSMSSSATQSSNSCPSFGVKPIIKNLGHNSREGHPLDECTDVGKSSCSQIVPDSEVQTQLPGAGLLEGDVGSVLALPLNDSRDDYAKQGLETSGSNEVSSAPQKDTAISLKVVDKAAPKLRRKSRFQTVSPSSVVKGNRDVSSIRGTVRAVKPVIRNKNLIIKKPKKIAISADGNSNTPHGVNNAKDHSSGQLICQRCQCSLKDTSKDSSKDLLNTTSAEALTSSTECDARKPNSITNGWVNRDTSVVKTIMASKSGEKGDISQSSKSSICDFSSSTTSLSDESNLSGSTCNNKPHMSKDMRWEAINHIRKNGFLGLNHFNLLKKLGSGDIGTVYLAELKGTNCHFAIKVMDNEFLARRKKMPRAQTEREILRMLDHPFLPTLYAQFTSDNLSCLVMEFCPGGDLHVLRQKQPGRYFPEQEARFYVAEVLLALEYLHMLGIVYRDLKPENILVREDGHIMLTDFDLSLRCSVNPTLVKSSSSAIEPPRISGPCAGSNCIDPFCTGPSCKVSCFSPRILPATARARKLKADAAAQARLLPQLVAEPTEARSNSFVGTHEYLAPEIIKGEGHGSAVDWWTFGVFLYELLYGKTPFKGSGNEETLANVVLQNLRFPDAPIVSFQARDLIRHLLVKEPENRLGTETGAAEIKRHPFFDGLNWALIRCAIPPQIPELYEVGNSQPASQEKGKRFLDCGGNGEHLEFELF